MKKILKYTFVGLMGCSVLTSCLDSALDTAPTDSMSGTTLLSNANSAMIPLNGIYRSMYTSWSPTDNTHQSFGISSYTIMADVMGDDMIMDAMGSGWYWYDCLYNVKSRYTSSAWRSYDIWNCYYTWISNANYILAAQETMSGTSEDVNYVIGQAYAIRAYSYFMLAQNFARTYKGHEEDPCCPIYTEPTVAGTEGQPRSTVQKVYELITSDIQTAIDKLTDAPAQKHKTHIDLSVAYGIQARIALTMEDWNLAKTAAHNAIEASGCTVLPVNDFLGLNDVTAANVMWGAPIQNDQAGMYASFLATWMQWMNWMSARSRMVTALENRLIRICMITLCCQPIRVNNGGIQLMQEANVVPMQVINRKNLNSLIIPLGWVIMFGCV